MAKLVLQLSQSLDGFVDHTAMKPDAVLFRHFVDRVGASSGGLFGRRVYELMDYWETDRPEWGPDEREFARVWRRLPKWVASRTLQSVRPGATLIKGDLGAAVRALKAEHEGEIEVAGPNLAQSLTELGLIDEYRLYIRPYVLGHGAPFFAGPTPPLRFISSNQIGEDTVRLCYAPA